MKLIDSTKRSFKANLHLHTTNSDGKRSPEEAIALYKSHGYDILAITDHWKITRETELVDGMLVLSGVEFDFNLPAQVIHMLGIGMDKSILDKVQRHLSAQRAVDEIVSSGGRAILAHPAWSLNSHDVICALQNVSAAEVYNTVSGIPWNGDRADSSGILDVAAAHGKLYPLVASDDTHFYSGEQCKSYTMIQADELSREGVLAALDAGAFYATQGPRFLDVTLENNVLSVRCSPIERIAFVSDLPWVGGRCRTGSGITEAEYQVQVQRFERFVRCQIWDAESNCAWTSPIALR